MKHTYRHNKKSIITASLTSSVLAISTVLTACGSSDTNSPQNNSSTPSSSSLSSSSMPSEQGFEASITDFVQYKDWTEVDYAVGATSNGLKGAHQGDNDDYSRITLMNETALNSQGEFAPGSIIIKETFTYERLNNSWQKHFAEQGGLLAMVKRGGDFNSDHNGWEWFMLASDLSSVIAQGDDLMDGACNACHSQASALGGMDYAFPTPTEYIADESLFANYLSWDMIEFTDSPHEKLGGAHLNGETPPLRRIYQKQLLANPSGSATVAYPVGTALVKDVAVEGDIEQIVAMVKRGADFNPNNGNWEWFILNPNDYSIALDDNGVALRGADLLNGACNACHSLATDELGSDFVFKHQHAPFNTEVSGEYVADKSALAQYNQWTLTDYTLAASNPFIGGAHSGSNAEFARAVFQNEQSAMRSGDSFAPGSIIVKETFTTGDGDKQFAEMGGVLAMVKRGGQYNPDHQGWEWLALTPEGNIAARSATLMNGACNACHSKAEGDAGTDYTFNKPSEFIATLADLQGYDSWTLIDTTTGDSPANGGAHRTDTIRKTFKKQASANPYLEADGYPVGTIVVKELSKNSAITGLYGMVKRGGGFNSDHGGWEWFLLNSDASEITARGANIGGGVCNICHSKAGDPTQTDASFMGKDYVFYHADDPVPMPVSAM